MLFSNLFCALNVQWSVVCDFRSKHIKDNVKKGIPSVKLQTYDIDNSTATNLPSIHV